MVGRDVAAFRRRCGEQFEPLFVQVLMLAREMGIKLGRIAIAGSKVKANASRHRTLSRGRIKKIEAQLRQEVRRPMALAENEGREPGPDGLDVPQETARRTRNRFTQHLAPFYSKQLFWHRAYCVGSVSLSAVVGGATLETVRAYVDAQGIEELARKAVAQAKAKANPPA